jgi:hypothetical protein
MKEVSEMGIVDKLLGRNTKAVTVYDYEGQHMDFDADLMVNGHKREVALFRPPVVLGPNGESLPGVDRQLVANYLVGTTGMLAEVDLGPVRVDWGQRVGRFATATMNMETWGQSVTVMMPVHVISSELETIMQMYQEAVCLKAQEIHRGHQDYSKPNRVLRRATKQLDKLRDAGHPHFTDAEYLFVYGNLAQAQVMNALVPLPVGEGEAVIGQTARVKPTDNRQPSGG